MNEFVQYLLTLDFSYPCNIGERTLAINIANALKSINPDFKVISSSSNVQELGYHIIRVKSVGIEYIDTVRIVHTLNTIHDGNGLSLIHLININYALALPLLKKKWKTRIKLIPYFYMLEHSRYLIGPRGYLKSNIAPKISAKFADLSIATSPLISKRLRVIGFKNVYTVLPPIDAQIFKPLNKDSARKEFKRIFNADIDFDNATLTLLYMGHLTPDRFPYTIILKMLRKLIKMNIVLNLIIFTPRQEYNINHSRNILKLRNDLEIKKYVFLQVRDLSTKEKVIVYNVADIFIYPALKPSAVDPPLTLLEALSCGTPSLATKIQSVPHIIRDHENGIIMNKLSDFLKFIKLLTRCELLEEMCKNARRVALSRFSISIVKNIFAKLISYVISDR